MPTRRCASAANSRRIQTRANGNARRVEAVQVDMGWASSETARRYVHALSTAEAQELIQRRFIDRLVTHARDLPSAMAQLRDTKQNNAKRHGVADESMTLDLDADAQRTIAWIASLGRSAG